MNELNNVKETLYYLSLIGTIISVVVGLIIRYYLSGVEKRINAKLDDANSKLDREARWRTDHDEKYWAAIRDLDKVKHETGLVMEKVMSHKDICEERHKD